MRHRHLTALTLGLALLGQSCKEGPKAGELQVDLTTPNSDDGAVQFTAIAAATFTLSGATAACSGCKLFVVKVSDSQYKGVVTGNIGAGALLRLGVSDTRKPANYSIVINAVSSRTFVIRSASGYSATLR
jgi:hypothetical protein